VHRSDGWNRYGHGEQDAQHQPSHFKSILQRRYRV